MTHFICVDLFEERPEDLIARIAAESAKPVKFRGVADEEVLWKPGEVLTVKFLEPDPALDPLVLEIASEWCKYANIDFAVTDQRGAHIRVSYSGQANQSKIGRASRPRDNFDRTPSMWIPSARDKDMRRRVVLHEFGHSLGLLHEHSSPRANIPWKHEAVLAKYDQLGLSQEWVEHNVLRRYDRPHVRATGFDRESVMLYPIDAALVEDPAFAVGWNMTLSPCDKHFIAKLYAGRLPPEGEVIPPCAADLE